MNYNNIIFYDFETGSKNPHRCQPIQLASVIIDGRRLEICDKSEFNSYIKPELDIETCKVYNLDPIEDEALSITGISLDDIKDAPSPKTVWTQFTEYIQKFNYKNTKWTAPIRAGFNNIYFDDIIIDRLCGGHNRIIKDYLKEHPELNIDYKKIREPYKFGPWDKDRNENTLFAPRDNIDIMRVFFWPWTENLDEVKSISMDNIRDWLGMSKTDSHNAMKDVYDGAELLIRFLKLTRQVSIKVNWTGKRI